jgi:hypothetical protein
VRETAQIIANGGKPAASARLNVAERAEPVGAVLSRGSQGTNRSAVARLEQWLHSVQSRRRDVAGSLN